MLSPLRFFAEPSPKTHLTASIIFDLPHPLGPTTEKISEGKGISWDPRKTEARKA
jgi:hypothetical protein